MKSYRDIKAWEKAHATCLRIYRLTHDFPSIERFRLVDQMCRSAASIPSNIAEGCGRNSDPDLARFFEIAKGSASELDYQLLLSKDLGYLDLKDYHDVKQLLDEVQKMLAAFIKRLRSTK